MDEFLRKLKGELKFHRENPEMAIVGAFIPTFTLTCVLRLLLMS